MVGATGATGAVGGVSRRPASLRDCFEPLRIGLEPPVRELRELDPHSKAARRARIKEGFEVLKAARRAGFEVTGAEIAGVPLTLGPPAPAPAEEPPRVSLFKARVVPKQKVVL